MFKGRMGQCFSQHPFRSFFLNHSGFSISPFRLAPESRRSGAEIITLEYEMTLLEKELLWILRSKLLNYV
jgi:hypothetical protein